VQVSDYSPPISPSLAQQQDALQKGLGRAMQWAMAGSLADQPLLDACLHDKRFDSQCEDNRGEWLWNIMDAAGAVGRFREPILEALRSITTESDAYQLCELAFHFATQGDVAFETALYEFVEKKPVADCPWIGEGQLLELGGETAFPLIARVRGRLLEQRDWKWDDAAVVDRAVEKLGEQRAQELLNSNDDAAIRRFLAGWRNYTSRPQEPQRQSHAERMRAITVDEILSAAKADDTRSVQFRFRGWGMHADEMDLAVVLRHLWNASETKVLVNLLKVFSNRPLPHFDAQLIELCRHSEPDVQRWAINALENNTHPLIRAFALAELRERTLNASVVGLFINNYVEGDENRLRELVEMPEDSWERHGVLIDVLNVLEKNPEADATQLALVAYFHTPCEMCRFRAVELLVAQDAAPRWLIEECRHDSAEDCRTLVEAN
jgi:hypothetical protein